MADTPDTGGIGGLLGIFGRGYDPAAAYSGLLTDPATKDAMTFRALAAMAGAFGEGAMPVPYKGGIPFAATLGKAGAAAYSGQDALIKARTEAAQQALYGAQGDVQKQNLLLGRAYLKNRMDAAAEDAAAGGGTGAGGPLALLQGAGGTKPIDLSVGTGGGSDPRGLVPYITQAAAARGIDPAVAVKVASTEGLGTFLGDGGRSGGAFQLYVGPQGKEGVGNQFMADTGLDPRDPKNEKATIDYALDHAVKNGWGAWNGAKAAGITGFYGIGKPTNGSPSAPGGMPSSLLAEVPNAAAQMADPTAGPVRSLLDAPPGGGLPALAPAPTAAAAPPPVRVNSRGQPYRPLGPGEAVSAGTPGAGPVITPEQASAANAANPRAGQTLPVMPSDYVFGKGMVAPPGAGRATPTPIPTVTSIPGGTNGIVPPGVPGPQGGLLAPQPGMGSPGPIPVSTAAVAPSDPTGGLLGPTLPPEALASLGLVPPPGGRPAQFAGPGAAGPAASAPIPPPPGPPGPVAPPNLTGVGGLLSQPPRPITSPGAPPPSAGLQLPPLIPGAGAAAPPPGAPIPGPAIPGATPPQPAVAPPGAPAAPTPGVPTVAQIKRAKDDEALLTLMGKPVPASVSKVAAFPVDVALAAEQARVKAPFTAVRPSGSFPQFDANGRVIGWQTAPAAPSIQPGPPTTAGQPTQQYVFPPSAPGGAPTVSAIPGPTGLSEQEKASGRAVGELAQGAGLPGMPIRPNLVPDGINPARPVQSPSNDGRSYQTNIPAVTKQAITSDVKTYTAAVPEWNRESAELSESGVLAQRAENNLQQIAHAFSMIETGTWQTEKQQFGGYLKALNIPVPDSLNQLSAVQEALHNNYKAQLATLAAATKKFTGGEYKVNTEAGTQPNIQPGANLNMLSTDIGLARQLQSLAQDWNHAQTMVASDGSRWVNPVSFKTAWTEENPLTSFINQTRREIAPMIKGGIPVLRNPTELNGLSPGSQYRRPDDPAGSYRIVPPR